MGPILLTLVAVLVQYGFFARTLDELRFSRRGALLLIAGMLLGSLVELPLVPGLTVNLGGTLLPLGLVVYFFRTAGSPTEPLWGLAGAALTAGCVYLIGRWFPPGQPTELNLFFLDAQYLYGLVAGLAGYLTGRSLRNAFAAACLGAMLADLIQFVLRVPGVVHVGGGGFQETAVAAGLLALTLAGWLGEARPAPPVNQ
ncbi:MAG TPA: hypothetical protein VGK74_11520 [Symbiobacteriaceae bacterium]